MQLAVFELVRTLTAGLTPSLAVMAGTALSRCLPCLRTITTSRYHWAPPRRPPRQLVNTQPLF